MANALTLADLSPGRGKGVARAQREPAGRFHALAHLIDGPALERAYHRQRPEAAVGVDGVTTEQYGQHVAANLQDLHARLKDTRYRHQPLRRVHLPKAQGKTRPIGISAFEEKGVQDAVREGLDAIYEQDFLDGSDGFRPQRSAHDAVRTLKRSVDRGEGRGIDEADIVSCFDRVDRTELQQRLEGRIADGSLMRRSGTCVHVGVLEGDVVAEPERGTTQGSVLSPLVGNVYVHHVLDRWFETEGKPRLRGQATLIRFWEDLLIGFEREDAARRGHAVLGKRVGRCGLTLHPDTTRVVPCRRPPKAQHSGKGPGTGDFVGCTFYWQRTRHGHWRMGCTTRRASLRRATTAIDDWCRRHRHQAMEAQHAALTRRVRGHCNDFGVSGNSRSVRRLVEATKRAWYTWLRRRSQRTRLNGERCTAMRLWWPLPRPRITVQMWGR